MTTQNNVAPQGAGARGGPGNRTPASIIETWYEFCCKRKKEEEEERRRKYEEWRRRNLGDCYYDRLDYSVGALVTAEIGESVLDVLKPGDRILVVFDISDDPCMQRDSYIDGYMPIYGKRCRCKRSEYDVYAIIRSSLYIRGVLKERRYNIPPLSNEEILSWLIYHKQLVVVEYRGDGIAEIVDTDDYDYYLHVEKVDFTYDDPVDDVEVEGAVWHAIYYVPYSDTIYDKSGNKIAELDVCCYDDVWSYFIALLLIRRGEIAKIKCFDSGKEKYERIVTASLPPVVRVASKARR